MEATITPQFCHYIPAINDLMPGILYISKKYESASHLCACGCRQLTVTPLSEGEWTLTENSDNTISLSPSIGNWQLDCRSHYVISNNKVEFCNDSGHKK